VLKCHAIKAYWGSESIAPHILNRGTMWKLVVNFAPWRKKVYECFNYDHDREVIVRNCFNECKCEKPEMTCSSSALFAADSVPKVSLWNPINLVEFL
jgi:hypothetical protein